MAIEWTAVTFPDPCFDPDVTKYATSAIDQPEPRASEMPNDPLGEKVWSMARVPPQGDVRGARWICFETPLPRIPPRMGLHGE